MSPEDVALASRFARILCARSRAEFDDLRQLILLKLFLAKKNYRPELGPWRPYAWRQALQALRDLTQNWRKERPRFVALHESHGVTPDHESAIDACRMLNRLEMKERRAVIMWAIEEWTDEEGGALEGMSQIGFRKRRRRGVAELREMAAAT